MNELKSIISTLQVAMLTEHGDLLCSGCYARNRPQLTRAAMQIEPVACAEVVECTLCGGPATD